MKQFVLACSIIATLCACATGTTNPPLSAGAASTTPATRDGAARPDKTPHIVYPVRSLYEVVYPLGNKAAAYTLNGTCSLTRGPKNVVTGCAISGGSASPYYRKSSFYLHNKPNGNGCTVAIGHFHGQTYAGQPIPIAFYWVKNACYP